MKKLSEKQQAITEAITAFVKEANKQGQQGVISAGLNDAIFGAYNQPKDCLTEQNLELIRTALNTWHESNEELSKAFIQANELND